MLLLLALTNAKVLDTFESFKATFGKTYDADEDLLRREVVEESARRVALINAEETGGTAVYGLTKFSDLTREELRRIHAPVTGRGKTALPAWDGTPCARCDATGAVPLAWDWRDHGAVTAVKDQGRCGNCFTFGATGDIEGTWFLAGNDLVALSEQQLTSCDRVGGDDGCRGGDTDLDTFKYVVKTGGICSEKQYPQSTWSYKFAISGKCDKTKLHDFTAKISGGVQISGGKTMPKNATAVMEAIYRSGPVTAAINSKYMDDYTKGIADPKTCKGTMNDLDHQILIVGYGTENGTDYWATDWGEDGYYRLIRGKNNCGICNDVSHSVA